MRARLVFVCFVVCRRFVFSCGGDAGGCQHSSRLVTQHDICTLQQFLCPCAVGLVAVGSVLGNDEGVGGGLGKGQGSKCQAHGGKNNLNHFYHIYSFSRLFDMVIHFQGACYGTSYFPPHF